MRKLPVLKFLKSVGETSLPDPDVVVKRPGKSKAEWDTSAEIARPRRTGLVFAQVRSWKSLVSFYGSGSLEFT